MCDLARFYPKKANMRGIGYFVPYRRFYSHISEICN